MTRPIKTTECAECGHHHDLMIYVMEKKVQPADTPVEARFMSASFKWYCGKNEFCDQDCYQTEDDSVTREVLEAAQQVDDDWFKEQQAKWGFADLDGAK